mmetsp:Transcript_96843/g.278103  ORF Transcript_96843/g.278103 Transcript_96843/m.278103 type:complete len:245 (-) Transcript_96843:756-1490(-)
MLCLAHLQELCCRRFWEQWSTRLRSRRKTVPGFLPLPSLSWWSLWRQYRPHRWHRRVCARRADMPRRHLQRPWRCTGTPRPWMEDGGWWATRSSWSAPRSSSRGPARGRTRGCGRNRSWPTRPARRSSATCSRPPPTASRCGRRTSGAGAGARSGPAPFGPTLRRQACRPVRGPSTARLAPRPSSGSLRSAWARCWSTRCGAASRWPPSIEPRLARPAPLLPARCYPALGAGTARSGRRCASRA